MKAKDIASQLGNLAAATNSMSSVYNTNDIETDIPDELYEPDPIFIVEHDKELNENEKKAFNSVKQIVNTIVPSVYQNNPIIKDKMLQDADQLGQLYYQQSMNNIMIKTIMDTIAKGDVSSKLFDSYTKLMSIAKDFNKQINEMQNQFRKYYIDTYMDLQHKEDEDIIIKNNSVNNSTIINNTDKPRALTAEYSEDNSDISRRETSTKDAVLKVQEMKKKLFKKRYEEQLKNENQ